MVFVIELEVPQLGNVFHQTIIYHYHIGGEHFPHLIRCKKGLCSHQGQFHELRPCFQKQNFIFNHCKPPNSPYAQEQCTATHTMHRLEH